jgi:hypothetical protein
MVQKGIDQEGSKAHANLRGRVYPSEAGAVKYSFRVVTNITFLYARGGRDVEPDQWGWFRASRERKRPE